MNRRELLFGTLLAPLVKPLAALVPAKQVIDVVAGGIDHLAFDPAKADMVIGMVSEATGIPVRHLVGQPGDAFVHGYMKTLARASAARLEDEAMDP